MSTLFTTTDNNNVSRNTQPPSSGQKQVILVMAAVPSNTGTSNKLHIITPQKKISLIFTAVKFSKLILITCFPSEPHTMGI
jgi:hypothetical protein